MTPSYLPFMLNVSASPQVFNSAAVDAQGNGVILYNHYNTAPSTDYLDVDAQLTDPQGNLVGDPIPVNTPTAGDHVAGGVAMAPDGNFVAVYYGAGPAAGYENVYARQFAADGTPLAAEFVVATNAYQPSVAIGPDDTFAVAYVANGQPDARIYSWDLSSVSAPIVLGPDSAAQGPQLSIAAAGTLVASYTTWGSSPAYVQQYTYAADGNGGFQVATQGDAVPLPAWMVDPVAEPGGGFVAAFVAYTDLASLIGVSNGDVDLQHFAADGTPVDADPVLVAATDPNSSPSLGGAGLDATGNLYLGWYYGALSDDSGWTLYAQRFTPAGTLLSAPLQMTPQSLSIDEPSASSSLAVAPDGSLLVGWRAPNPTTGNMSVMARHYDPIVNSTAETDTLTDGAGNQVSVVSQATTLANSVLWEYWVTNHGSSALGQFSIAGQPADITDGMSSLGWAMDSADAGWTAGSSDTLLAPGQEAYFTFTTPSANPIQGASAQGNAANGSFTAVGTVLGPGSMVPENDTLMAGTFVGQILVTTTLIPSDGNVVWDYEVTNTGSTSIGQLAFLDEPADASSFNSSLGWAENEAGTGWAAGPTDRLLDPAETADFNFTTPLVEAGEVAVRASSSDGTATAEGTVLGPSDPPTNTQTSTTTLTDAAGDTVQVTATATTFSSYVQWQYAVTNDSSQNLGQFSISGQPEGVMDGASSLGWTMNSTGTGWTVGVFGEQLISGQTGYFTFTTPIEYAIQSTAAQASGSTVFSGSVLGMGLTGPETDSLTAGSLGGQISVVSSATPDGNGNLIWDYEVTNNSSTSIGEFAFLDEPVDASSFNSSLGWAENEADTGWAAGPTDTLLAPSQTADFNFATPSVTAGHIAVRATSADGTATAEANVLGPSDPPTATQTNSATLTDGAGDNVTVTSTATTFASYVLWQYSVTDNSSQSLGNFTIPGFTGPLTDVSDESSSTGWTSDGSDLGWTAGSSGQQLGSGQTASFSFTTPWAYGPGNTGAQTGGGGSGGTESGTVPGPQPRVVYTETYTSMMTVPDNGEQVQIVSTATEYTDHILWQYQVNNLTYTLGSYDYPNGQPVDGFWLFSVAHPGTPTVTAVSNDQGWSYDDTGTSGLGVAWTGVQNDVPMPVQPGQTANFSYITPIVPIGLVGATIGTGDLAFLFGAQVLGAPPAPPAVQGPSAVPGNSTYRYAVTFPQPLNQNGLILGTPKTNFLIHKTVNGVPTIEVGGDAGAVALVFLSGWTPGQQPGTVAGAWAEVAFKNSPADIQIQFFDMKDSSQPPKPIPWTPEEVYIVQINVATPGDAFQTDNKVTAPNGTVNVNETINGVKGTANDKAIYSFDPNGNNPGLYWTANVSLVGPGPNHDLGLSLIEVGFYQEATITSNSVHFPASGTLKSSDIGKTYSDFGDDGGPWYSSYDSGIFLGSTGSSQPISMWDRPKTGMPMIFYKANGNDTQPDSVSYHVNFTLDVMAVDLDPNQLVGGQTQTYYWKEANAAGPNANVSWSFDGSGKIGAGPAYPWTADPIAGIVAPTTWRPQKGPQYEVITSVSAGQALRSQTWST